MFFFKSSLPPSHTCLLLNRELPHAATHTSSLIPPAAEHYCKCSLTSRMVIDGVLKSGTHWHLGQPHLLFSTQQSVRSKSAHVDTTCLISKFWCSRNAAMSSNCVAHLAHRGLFFSWQAIARLLLWYCLSNFTRRDSLLRKNIKSVPF